LSATPEEITAARRKQRVIFVLGVGAAAIPIVCQLVVAVIVALASPDDFPKADKTILSIRFWDTQVLLLCIAVAANTLVDFFKLVMVQSITKPVFVLKVSFLGLLFLALSICFSVNLLDEEEVAEVGGAILVLGCVILFLSYRIDMDLAVIEADN
jgi:hypothetical protein